jgi:hypothetical protein
MMRSGRLLVEESPENLLNSYRLPSLEEVFLKICIRDGVKNRVEQRIGVVSSTSSPVITCQNGAQAQQSSADHVNMAFDDSISQISVSEVEHSKFPVSPSSTPSSEVKKKKKSLKCVTYLECFDLEIFI